MKIQICTHIKEGCAPLYKAYEIKDNVGFFNHHLSNNILALVEELETLTPKPVITFDDTARIAFWKSLT